MRIFRFSAEFNDVKACGAHRRAYFLFCSMILHFKVATVSVKFLTSTVYTVNPRIYIRGGHFILSKKYKGPSEVT